MYTDTVTSLQVTSAQVLDSSSWPHVSSFLRVYRHESSLTRDTVLTSRHATLIVHNAKRGALVLSVAHK